MKKKSENHVTHAHDKFVRTVMSDPRVAREFFTLHLPEEVRKVTDLGKIEDNELKQHAWAGIMEFALKHIFAREIMPYLQDIAELLHHIDQSGGRNYISIVLQYILERGELKDQQAFFDLINKRISPEVGEKIMSLAEQLKAEGVAEGVQKGKMEIVERLLAEKTELAFIAKVTGLSLAKIREIQKKH